MSTCKLGRHFMARSHQVAVFSFASSGHSDSEPMELFKAPAPGGAAHPKNLDHLRERLRSIRPDVVINQMPYEHRIGAVLAAEKPPLLLACLRNTLFSVRLNMDAYVEQAVPERVRPLFRNKVGKRLLLARHRRRHRKDLERILDTYDHFVMFGPPNMEELSYFVPNFERERIRLIPNSVPTVPDAVPEKEKRILWLGRISREQKCAELIPDVWQRVQEDLPDWTLDVVGDGPALEEIRRVAGTKGLDRIHFHGRQVPDEYYRRSSVFFMTSAFEGFPNTLVEAQAAGAVPVAFDSYPVASWLIDSGQNGCLVPAFDVGAMASEIIELAHDEQRRSRLAMGALEAARQFHIDTVGARWQELFDEGVERGRSRAK